MLGRLSNGFGALAFAGLSQAYSAPTRPAHFRPKAKSVIFLYMSGGVSHVDSFDPKPLLERTHGKPMPTPVERTQCCRSDR